MSAYLYKEIFKKLSLSKGADICHSQKLEMTDTLKGERPWLIFCKNIESTLTPLFLKQTVLSNPQFVVILGNEEKCTETWFCLFTLLSSPAKQNKDHSRLCLPSLSKINAVPSPSDPAGSGDIRWFQNPHVFSPFEAFHLQ